MDRKINLESATLIKDGRRIVRYPKETFDFSTVLINLLIEKGFIHEPVLLEDLHHYISKEDQCVDGNLLNNISKNFYDTNPHFNKYYFELIKWIANEVLQFDFIFQTTPTIRFHFPVPLIDKYRAKNWPFLSSPHIDSMVGHSIDELNFWLPFTNCYGTNALRCTDLDSGIVALRELCQDFDFNLETFTEQGRDLLEKKIMAEEEFFSLVVNNCRSVEMKAGELLMFDSRCIHGTLENVEKHTRVSMDFRLFPIHLYENQTYTYQAKKTGRMLIKGDVFFEKSAFEILEEI